MSVDTTTTTDVDSVQADESPELDTSTTQAVDVDNTSDTDQTTVEAKESSEEAELLEWASKKGIKTDDPVAILKMARESEKMMHSATQEAKALKNSVEAVSEDEGLDRSDTLLNRLQVTEFYLNNPGAKDLDEQMAEIVTAKPYLANDLDTVYELAKSRASAVDNIAARQDGRKEALAQVAKAEKAAPPNASATTRQGKEDVTDADIANMTASEYIAFKKETGFDPFRT
jgi:uncharacterized membrane protein YgaE (UPF0421/DUF939 family)